jgi:hypothetical protein
MKTSIRPAVTTIAVVLAVSTLLGCIPVAARRSVAVGPYPVMARDVISQVAVIPSRSMTL